MTDGPVIARAAVDPVVVVDGETVVVVTGSVVVVGVDFECAVVVDRAVEGLFAPGVLEVVVEVLPVPLKAFEVGEPRVILAGVE